MNHPALEFQRVITVATRAYLGTVTQRGFLLFTFGLPVFFALIAIVTAIIATLILGSAVTPVGPLPVAVVDLTETFDDPSQSSIANSPLSVFQGNVRMLPYESEVVAAQALAAGEVQAYFIIPANYFDTGVVRLHYDEPISQLIPEVFEAWITNQLQRRMPPDLMARYEAGPVLTQ